MRHYILTPILTVSIVLIATSCRKGRTMPVEVPVVYEWEISDIHISGPPNMIYTNGLTQENLALSFRNELADYLEENKVVESTRTPKFTLKITDITVKESVHMQTFKDTCSFPVRYKEYEARMLIFNAEVKLYDERGEYIETYHECINKWESGTPTGCGEPTIRSINCDVPCLQEKILKNFRKGIANKIHKEMDF